jgi:hypothetical protein
MLEFWAWRRPATVGRSGARTKGGDDDGDDGILRYLEGGRGLPPTTPQWLASLQVEYLISARPSHLLLLPLPLR